MTIRKLGLMALVLAAMLPFAALAEADPDEDWDEHAPVYDWEVRDGTMFVKDGVEYLGYLTLDDEEQYGSLVNFDLSYELDAFHFDPEELPESFDKLHLPSSLRIVGNYAFYNVHFFEEINLPEGLEEMHNGCMEFCSAKQVTLPATVRLVEPGAFIDAYNLETIEVSPDNPWYTSVDGVLYTKDKATLVAYPPGRDDQHFDVPAGVKEIGEMAFCGDWSLHSVSLPFGVERIDRAGFSGCVYLEAVSLPPTLREIEVRAFADCVLLERINLPRHVVAVNEDGEKIKADTVFDNTPALKDCWMKESLSQEDKQTPETHEDNWQYTFDDVDLFGIVNPEDARATVEVYESIYDRNAVTSLPCGDTIRVLGISESWCKIQWNEADRGICNGYMPTDSLLIRRTWEPLYHLTAATPAHQGITYRIGRGRIDIPADRIEEPLIPEKDSIAYPSQCGQWICCGLDTEDGYRYAYFAPADLNLTRYDTHDGKTYGMVVSDDLRDRLNLRAKPDKGSESLGKYFSGTQVEILEEQGDWYKVRVDFQEGWMMKEYVRIVPVATEENLAE
ncbi:MAG: leucine-rich repeat protein [Bacteroidaceae bacterium]|nr:leucine-rich repeat protein [Bacteroidaceae bacterium]